MFADFFFDQKEAAFANIVWQSGGASTIAFIFMSKIDPEVIAYLGMIFAMFSIPGYWAAKKIYDAEQLVAGKGAAAVVANRDAGNTMRVSRANQIAQEAGRAYDAEVAGGGARNSRDVQQSLPQQQVKRPSFASFFIFVLHAAALM